jgi:hypothetical protein
MVQDGHQDQHQTVPDKQDFLQTIVSDGRSIILDVWIAIEKLVSPAEDENAAKQKDDHGESESDAERRNASLFNHRYHQGTIRFHGKSVSMPSIDSTMRPEDFPMLRKEGLRLPLRR